tara:strand:+ start:389 stop:577 length:189 start_codon:yes stop_codon:yes gene_type:complete
MSLEELINDLAYITKEELGNFCANYSIEDTQDLLQFLSQLTDEESVQEVSNELHLNTPSLNY